MFGQSVPVFCPENFPFVQRRVQSHNLLGWNRETEVKEELLTGPGEADNFLRDCLTIFMLLACICGWRWLLQGRSITKAGLFLCEDDGTMPCTKQQKGYSSQYHDLTKGFLPACGPFHLLLLPSQVLWPPYSLPSREGNSPAAKTRTRDNCQPLPCQGQASW